MAEQRQRERLVGVDVGAERVTPVTMAASDTTRWRRQTSLFLQDLVLMGTVALLFTDLPWVVYAAMAAFQVAAIYLMWPRCAE